MTSSNIDLDIAPNGTDDGTPYGSTITNRRPKRAVQSFEISGPGGDVNGEGGNPGSALTKGRPSAVVVPLLFFLHLLSYVRRILVAILPEFLTRPLTNLLEDDRRADEIIQEMPAKQDKLREDAETVARDQAAIRANMDNLKERIRRMEERRERWAAEAAKIDDAKRAAEGAGGRQAAADAKGSKSQ